LQKGGWNRNIWESSQCFSDFRWALPEYGIQTEPANVQSAEF
jgi:hypothetical protein